MNITDFNDLTLAVNRVRNLAVVIMHGKCTGLLSVRESRDFLCTASQGYPATRRPGLRNSAARLSG